MGTSLQSGCVHVHARKYPDHFPCSHVEHLIFLFPIVPPIVPPIWKILIFLFLNQLFTLFWCQFTLATLTVLPRCLTSVILVILVSIAKRNNHYIRAIIEIHILSSFRKILIFAIIPECLDGFFCLVSGIKSLSFVFLSP